MGSKSRIAKYIFPIIQKYIDENNIEYSIEPFCGGLNVIDKIKCNHKIAADKHKYLIALFDNLDKIDSLPEFVTKEHYSEVRNSFNKRDRKFEDWYIGAIGFLASYNGRFFDGGYAGLVDTKSGITRNYYDEAKRNLLVQRDDIKNISFINYDYNFWYVNGVEYENTLFYCDPPYQNVKQYGISKNFNHDEFWKWCRKLSKKNIVLISEQNAPQDFECIWEQEVNRTIDNNKRVKATEKLFKWNGGVSHE